MPDGTEPHALDQPGDAADPAASDVAVTGTGTDGTGTISPARLVAELSTVTVVTILGAITVLLLLIWLARSAPEALTLIAIGTIKAVPRAMVYYYTGHRPTFRGTSAPGATITIVIDSDPITLTTIADASGSWSVTPPQDLLNGKHHVAITAAKDGASSTLSYVLGINTGLAETGDSQWPILLAGGTVLLASYGKLRRTGAHPGSTRSAS